jgi:hypothetical protein
MSEFSSAATNSAIHRKTRTSSSEKFSPSYGVHKGYIPDPNWPPAELPEGARAMSRKSRRQVMTYNVLVQNKWVEVKGDLSKGGALFLLPERMEQKYAHVHYGSHVARVEILSTSKKGSMFGHHCRFIDEKESAPLWEAAKYS